MCWLLAIVPWQSTVGTSYEASLRVGRSFLVGTSYKVSLRVGRSFLVVFFFFPYDFICERPVKRRSWKLHNYPAQKASEGCSWLRA